MTKTEILKDIDYVKSLGQEGRYAPPLGGPIGLWWGCLLVITLYVHYLAEIGKGPLSINMIGFLWLVFGIVGGLGSVVFGRLMSKKPGASSINNRLASALWTGNTILIFIYAVSAALSAGYGKIDFIIMDTIMTLSFGLYALTAFVLYRLSDQKIHLILGMLSIIFVPISLLLLGKPELYIAAIAATFCTVIVPAIINIRNEPKA